MIKSLATPLFVSQVIGLKQCTTLLAFKRWIYGGGIHKCTSQTASNAKSLFVKTSSCVREKIYYWTDYTGTTLADVITQWSSSGNPLIIICIIGTHWKTTGATSTLDCHWNNTVGSQWQSSVNLHNWNTLEALEAHWKRNGNTGYQQLLLQWHSIVHCGLNSRHTALPLDYHWITTGSG